MIQQSTQPNRPKKRITDEIMHQIGKSVIFVFLIVAILAICMVGWTIMTSKETELTLESSAVDRVNAMIKKTAENSAVQAENMEQLRTGIDEIARAIQDNSAASQETSATSEELATQAELLNKMLQKFELIH